MGFACPFRDRRGTRALVAVVAALAVAGPAAAATRIEKVLKLAPGGTFSLKTDGGSIELRGGGSEARVVLTSPKDDISQRYDLRFEEHTGGVTVSAERKDSSWLGMWKSGDNLRWEVTVPTDCEVRLDTSGGSIDVAEVRGPAEADTSGGSITVRAVQADVHADTSGGSIRVEDVGGNARLDTSGGSIEADRVRGRVDADTSGGHIRVSAVDGEVRADTSGGSIEITDAGAEVQASTSGGSVRVVFRPGNAKGGSLETSGGGIEVRIDPSVGLDLDASCSGGKVRTDLPVGVVGTVAENGLRGKVNGGGASLRLRSSAGGIRILPL